MYRIISDLSAGSFCLEIDGKQVIAHSAAVPAVFVGCGVEKITMHTGNFDITDRIDERFALKFAGEANGVITFTHPEMQGSLCASIEENDKGIVTLKTECSDKSFNRFFIKHLSRIIFRNFIYY